MICPHNEDCFNCPETDCIATESAFVKKGTDPKKQKIYERINRWKHANPNKMREYHHKYYERNKDRVKQKNREYYEKHREELNKKAAVRHKKYYAAHREEICARVRERYRRKKAEQGQNNV